MNNEIISVATKCKPRTEWTPTLIIKEAHALLETLTPKTFNISFFEKHNRILHRAITAKYRSNDPSNPYTEFILALEPCWQKRFQMLRPWTRDLIIKEAHSLLETHQPETFNISFFEDHNQGLYKAIKGKYRSGDPINPYKDFVDALDPDWQKRFQIQRLWTQDLIIEEAHMLLQNHQPETFSICFFQTHKRILYRAIQGEYRSDDPGNPYKDFVDALDPDWQKRFTYREQPTFLESVQKLEVLVENLNPKFFGPTFIAKNSKSLYDFFSVQLKRNGIIHWNILVDTLTTKIRKRWKAYPRRDITKLRALLKNQNPSKFHVRWIEGHDEKLANRLQNKVYLSKGKVTWESIFGQLGNDPFGKPWISRWAKKRFYAELVPKNPYWDPVPIEKIQELHRDKLYVFVEQMDKNDRVHFEEISAKLIALAQAGNNCALELLQSYLYFTVQRLIDNNGLTYNQKLLSRLNNYQAMVDEEITKCIYRFNYRGKFFSYLYKSLIGLTWKVGHTNFSLNEEFGGELELKESFFEERCLTAHA